MRSIVHRTALAAGLTLAAACADAPTGLDLDPDLARNEKNGGNGRGGAGTTLTATKTATGFNEHRTEYDWTLEKQLVAILDEHMIPEPSTTETSLAPRTNIGLHLSHHRGHHRIGLFALTGCRSLAATSGEWIRNLHIRVDTAITSELSSRSAVLRGCDRGGRVRGCSLKKSPTRCVVLGPGGSHVRESSSCARLSHHKPAIVVLNRTGNHLAGAGCMTIDQCDEWSRGERAIGGHAKLLIGATARVTDESAGREKQA